MSKAFLLATSAWRALPAVPKHLEWWTRAYCRAFLQKVDEVAAANGRRK